MGKKIYWGLFCILLAILAASLFQYWGWTTSFLEGVALLVGGMVLAIAWANCRHLRLALQPATRRYWQWGDLFDLGILAFILIGALVFSYQKGGWVSLAWVSALVLSYFLFCVNGRAFTVRTRAQNARTRQDQEDAFEEQQLAREAEQEKLEAPGMSLIAELNEKLNELGLPRVEIVSSFMDVRRFFIWYEEGNKTIIPVTNLQAIDDVLATVAYLLSAKQLKARYENDLNRYTRGEMVGDELDAFELRLTFDPGLLEDVEVVRLLQTQQGNASTTASLLKGIAKPPGD